MAQFRDRRGGGGGQVFEFHPVGVDAFDPKPHQPKPGDPVRYSNQSGVGQAKGPFRYVEHAETGEFKGMVLRSSLRSPKKGKGK